MRCIFCKQNADTSKSIEHIIPESLGNVEHVLPPGIVCDKCNNYFSRKIERPLLESDYFVQLRFRNSIVSKKGRIPNLKLIHLASRTWVEIDKNGDSSIYPSKEKDAENFIKSILSTQTGRLIGLVAQEPEELLVSRFLGKVAIEALIFKGDINSQSWVDEVTDKQELDLLRNYVRFGNSNLIWPFHRRIIYSENTLFHEENYGTYEVLHEFKFLFTEESDLYFILAISGVEYALCMDKPDITSYINWLKNNDNKSPLYPDKT